MPGLKASYVPPKSFAPSGVDASVNTHLLTPYGIPSFSSSQMFSVFINLTKFFMLHEMVASSHGSWMGLPYYFAV